MSRSLPLALGLALTAVVVTTACSDPPPPPAPTVTITAATPPPPPAVPVSTDETKALALKGQFPPGPELNVFMAKCGICHSTSYISQQRLTPAQWEKTIVKMKGWGAPITDDEVAPLTAYFSTHFPVGFGAPQLAIVAPPAGATSEGTP